MIDNMQQHWLPRVVKAAHRAEEGDSGPPRLFRRAEQGPLTAGRCVSWGGAWGGGIQGPWEGGAEQLRSLALKAYRSALRRLPEHRGRPWGSVQAAAPPPPQAFWGRIIWPRGGAGAPLALPSREGSLLSFGGGFSFLGPAARSSPCRNSFSRPL